AITDRQGGELSAVQLYELFRAVYLDAPETYELAGYTHYTSDAGDVLSARLKHAGAELTIEGEGNGPIAGLVHGFERTGVAITGLDYHEHALSTAEAASTAAYIQLLDAGELRR